MKNQILEKLKQLNQQEKKDLLFEFFYSYNHNLIKIKNKWFETDDINFLKNLIEAGVEVNSKNHFHATPLFYAKSKEIAEILIQHGADVKAEDISSQTPLFYSESKEVVELLIQAGVDVNAQNHVGATSLSYIQSKEMAEVLIKHGADVNRRDKNGNTPLHWCNNQEIMELLIQAGADINIKNKNKETPSEYHRKNGHSDLADFMEQKAIEFERKKLNQVLPQSQKNSNYSKYRL